MLHTSSPKSHSKVVGETTFEKIILTVIKKWWFTTIKTNSSVGSSSDQRSSGLFEKARPLKVDVSETLK
jgi:predicted transcriptional regulator